MDEDKTVIMTVELDKLKHAVELLKRYVPSFQDPSHHCIHQDIHAVHHLETVVKRAEKA